MTGGPDGYVDVAFYGCFGLEFFSTLVAPCSDLGVDVRFECVTGGGGVLDLPLFQVSLERPFLSAGAGDGMDERFAEVGYCLGEPGELSDEAERSVEHT